ncbi:MAG: hypothetical protein ABIR62_03160 [Dokdonella sp.]|uniref:hypothetical protein n=1 Tax=Dokdonella sp. TaxID=2291710 RepID=UPI003267173B
MKRSSLARWLPLGLAACAGVSQAVTLNPRGLGQALVYPYYTVNKGQDTLVSLVNGSDFGKLVAVRFLEGYNGQTVLEFGVFLAAHETWTASLSQTSDAGGAAVHTADHSCTYPAIGSAGQPFLTSRFNDGGPQGATRTREGSFEAIAMGDIVPGSATDARILRIQGIEPGGTLPGDCPLTAESYIATLADLVTPTSGLFGSGSIVNVGQGTLFAYNADALSGFTDIPFSSPTADFGSVSLMAANSSESVMSARAHVFAQLHAADDGFPFAIDFPNGIDAVSAVFMADTIHNDYLVAAGLGANTDWIVTFPTKHFYVDRAANPSGRFYPFAQPFDAPGKSEVTFGAKIYDQEEGFTTVGGPCGFCPPPLPLPSLPYQVNAISFMAQPGAPLVSGVLGSNLTTNLAPHASAGTVEFDLASIDYGDRAHVLSGYGVDNPNDSVELYGLPVTGFMVYNIVNANAQAGSLANYGGLFRHAKRTLYGRASFSR